jgi:fructokinase
MPTLDANISANTTAVMPALVYTGPLAGVELTTRPVPEIRDDDVLVRIAATGVCGTDRGILLGNFPAVSGVILGHEAVGEVAAVGPAVSSLHPGDKVVINPTYYCGTCRPCRRGAPEHCEAKEGREIGVDCDGTMAGYIALPGRFAHRLPDGMSLRRATQVEPLACVLNNLAAAEPRPGDHILVLGAGPIGTLCAFVLAAQGARVSLVERDPRRAELARSMLPARVPVSSGLGSGLRPDIIIDAVGTLLEEALERIETGGTVVVMGEREGVGATVALRSLVTRGLRIVGAGPYSPRDFELALDLARDLPLEAMVTHELPLARYAEGFGLLAAGPGNGGSYGAMKVLLVSHDGVLS